MPAIKNIYWQALAHAAGVTAYIFLVIKLITIVGKYSPETKVPVLGPMIFLLVFVLSAAITASLVLGRPLLYYLDGKKTEGVKMFLATIGWLAVILAGGVLFVVKFYF